MPDLKHNVVQYAVLQGATPKDLEDAVHKALKDGWVPIGGVAIGTFQNRVAHYAQAMVKTN